MRFGLWEILMIGVLLLPLVSFSFCAPSLVAAVRHHRNLAGIIAINALLGWTVLGWLGALVWSLTSNIAASEEKSPRQNSRS